MRLSFGVIAMMAALLVMGCIDRSAELEKQVTQLQEDLNAANQKASELEVKLGQSSISESDIQRLVDERTRHLPELIKAEALKRSCVADARFNVRHDGQGSFRDAVKTGMNQRQAQLISQSPDRDLYQARDITEDEFKEMVGLIKALANAHGMKLPLDSLDEFPSCPSREAKSEHVPAFGGERDSCEAVLKRTINLQVPSGTKYWLYDDKGGLQAQGSAVVKEEPIGCQEQAKEINVYAMLIRKLASQDFPNQTFEVVSYRKIMLPNPNGGLGKRITLANVNQQPACPSATEDSNAIPQGARVEFEGVLARELGHRC